VTDYFLIGVNAVGVT